MESVVVENNHLSTGEKFTLSQKEKKYAASCQGENAGDSDCQSLKKDIDALHEKGSSIDKVEVNELGPDFQLAGTEKHDNKPGDIVSCVNSGNGFCVVTDKSAHNGREWVLAEASEIQAIAAKHQNGKAEDFIKDLGAAYFDAGCGMPGIASTLCQSYRAAGGANPIGGKVPTDAERVVWGMEAAANTAGGMAAWKGGKEGKAPTENVGKNNANNFDIKQLPDAHGNNHVTAVKGDAHVPVDKVELFMRGKSSGDILALQKN